MKKVLFLVAIVVLVCAYTVTADSNFDALKAQFHELLKTDPAAAVRAAVCEFGGYNLNKLKGTTYFGKDPVKQQYRFELDFCAKSSHQECGEIDGSICQYDESQNDSFSGSLGSFTNEQNPPIYKYVVEDDPSAGIDVLFTNGGQCYSAGWVDRETTLRLTCGDAPEKFVVSEDPACQYFIDFPTKLLCKGGGGSSGGLSGGAIFLICVLAVAVIYIITGCAICITRFGKPFGLQACPHRAFWFSLPGLFVAGIKYTFGKIAGCCGSKTITTSSGEYEAA